MEDDAPAMENGENLISSFCEITSSSRDEAKFFLESHQWDLDAAVSTFLDNDPVSYAAGEPNPSAHQLPQPSAPARASSPSHSQSPGYSPSESSPSRSRSPSPDRGAPYLLRSRRAASKHQAENPEGSRRTRSSQRSGNIRTFTDLNRSPPDGAGSDSDDAEEYYTGGEKSGMLVQDLKKAKDVDEIFDQARHSAVERPVDPSRSTFRSFTGTARLLSGETVSSSPQQQQDQPQVIMHTITFWRNGFTVDDGPLRRLDDPANASFLESISRSECPQELEPTDRRIRVHVDLIRREENFTEPRKGQAPPPPFQGVGRTLGAANPPSSGSTTSEPPASPLNTAPPPSMGLVIDPSAPTTSIQLRLADGTRLVSRFNIHHTVRDVRAFIEASRPGGNRGYQLLTMGFPPKQLADLDQTIEQAGIGNSVVIQKF
ncbi:PREDICTED: plant UBX domain-containing protein 5 [Tarenaya hassleriana]|uniref:plant UBX domain-containing protein 5 n=1 Tax=Tarenaya hassleriana TaxID=28532 RepID=UPI00053C84F3|nr:PREDICTED: plant UBX domain-containing protein 5 [Tarenaya hassleriana]